MLGIAAAVPVPLLLITGGLILSLLSSGGDVEVPLAHADEVAEWAGEADRQLGDRVRYEDRGLLPLVERHSRGRAGPLAIALYRHVPGWQQNGMCLTTLILLAVLFVAAASFFSVLLDRAALRSAERAATQLRWSIHRQAFQLAASEALRGREADAAELFRDKTERVRQGLAYWRRVWPRNAIIIVLCTALALAIHLWLALAAILMASGAALLLNYLEQRPRHRKALLSDRAGVRMSLLIESLRQIRLARGLLIDDAPGEPFTAGLERYHREAIDRDMADILDRPLEWFVIAIAAGGYAWLSGVLALREPPNTTLAEAATLAAALGWIAPVAQQLGRLRRSTEMADRAAHDIFIYLDRSPIVSQAPTAKDLAPFSKSIEFRGVTLADRAGHKLIDDASFSIPAGSRTALLASESQSIKALACLLPRFYDPAKGTIAFDNQDLRQCTLESLRQQVVLLLQEDLLFTGSVAENIRCGDPRYSASQVTEAARGSQAYEMIQNLPQGFETIVGNHGMRLEPAEAQLIGLARVLLRKPKVVILEEPDGLFDDQTDALLEQAIARVVKGRTLIVLPTRLRTLREADRILLFHQGKLHAEGRHADLLQRSELYRHLHYLRFNEFRATLR